VLEAKQELLVCVGRCAVMHMGVFRCVCHCTEDGNVMKTRDSRLLFVWWCSWQFISWSNGWM